MREAPVPVLSSVLAPAALAAVGARRYELAPPVRCRLVARGLNDTEMC